MRTFSPFMRQAIPLIGIALGFACCPALAADAKGLFDRPLREQHLPLPPDPVNPQTKPMLSCFYFPHLMVKQVDMGEVGAEQLSMTYLAKGQAAPACRRENAKGETVITNWSGYFKGVKNDYVFFSGADGSNGGEGLAIFNAADGERLFADNVTELHAVALTGPVQDPDQRPWYENPLVLRYRKVYLAPCSMRADAPHCWSRIKQVTGLTQPAAPDCSASYVAEEKHEAPEQQAGVRADPSVIEYEVEAALDSQGVDRLVPVSPVLACNAAE